MHGTCKSSCYHPQITSEMESLVLYSVDYVLRLDNWNLLDPGS
jgi:hypothetical protein